MKDLHDSTIDYINPVAEELTGWRLEDAMGRPVEEVFRAEGRMMGIDFEEDADAALGACAGGMGGYFRGDLPDGRKMVHLMKDHVPFSIQFGR